MTELADFVKDHGVHVPIENFTKSQDVYWMLRGLGLEVTVAHATDLKHISESMNKNDDNDAAIIDHYGMYQFEMSLDGNPQIVCRKAKINNERKWQYSFRDVTKAANEEYAYLQKNKDDYDPKDHEARREEFGTIVFESDYDCPCELIYKAYEERWIIEMVFRYYRDVNEFDETRVHSDYSVISSEFVCFLSSIISRILKRFDSAKSLDNLSYGKSMAVLERAKKIRIRQMEPGQVDRLGQRDINRSGAHP